MNNPDAGSEPVNIGNPHEITVLELAEIVIELTGSLSKVDYLRLPSDDPLQRCPDISRAKELLGWKPKVDLRAGLSKTIQYFDTLLSFDQKIAEAAE